MNIYKLLREKIKNKKATIGILGIGYVGRLLSCLTSSKRFNTIGFDLKKDKIDEINALNKPNLIATNDFSKLSTCDVICIIVPTPIDKTNNPDLTFIKKATKTLYKHLRVGQLIILQSTVSVGTTRKVVLPILKQKKLIPEKDFFLAFAPERIDPSNKKYDIKTIPVVVAGLEKKSLNLISSFFSIIFDKIVPVKSLEEAELCKLLENTYRFININFINEMTEYANKKSINIWNVIDAAKTKPFGFMPFYPGPGIGGHCIPTDPYYLYEDAKKASIPMNILHATMSSHEKRLNNLFKKIKSFIKGKKDFKLFIIGLTIKKDSTDIRESISIKIWEKAKNIGLGISYYDPLIPSYMNIKRKSITSASLKAKDLIVILVNHKEIDKKVLLKANIPIIDTKNIFLEKHDNVYKF